MAYHEFIVKISGPSQDALVRRLSDFGCLGVQEHDEMITAYFPDTADVRPITNELSVFQALLKKSGIKRDMSWHHNLIPDTDWNESWKKAFILIDIGKRFTIRPPWEAPVPGRINLVIDPGMAFGTGHHETTRSCLVLMERYAEQAGKERFLDLGTGTGLLAIAALKLGYEEVVAADTDPLSIEATRKNIGLNQAEAISLFEGSITNVHGAFDMIVANIISGVLVRLASDIASSLTPTGLAILSGILSEQADEVVSAHEQSGMTIHQLFPDGKWISIVAGRRQA